jgi:vacuolar-type H+-ATPase subunit E/Vma4
VDSEVALNDKLKLIQSNKEVLERKIQEYERKLKSVTMSQDQSSEDF